MFFTMIFSMGLVAIGAMGYMPSGKEHFLTDALLRDLVERMSNDLADISDSYLSYPPFPRQHKDLELEEPLYGSEYDLQEASNPSTRDREYLEHSSLWGGQLVGGGAGEGQRIRPQATLPNRQEIKTDATLPAYCNPPNPCPIGYTEAQGCTTEFENTAAFSRRYQSQQDCMCDSEHMFDCPPSPALSSRQDQLRSGGLNEIEFGRFLQSMQNNDQIAHKSLVAKKYHIDKVSHNPYLLGERLPVAAKKGTGVLH